MRLKRTVDPIGEPLRLSQAKLHLRVDHGDEDAVIDALITVSRETVEDGTRRALLTQTWQLTLDCWPVGDRIALPRPPLQSVSSIKYYGTDNTEYTFPSSSYIVDTSGDPGAVVLAYGQTWPTVTLRPAAAVQVTYVAGFGDRSESVPEQYRQMMRLLIGHWYENKEATAWIPGLRSIETPLAYKALLHLNRA